ncbi:MAG: cohesin domain-containing protein [Cellvibrio sp.]|uniref:cohesin domain-containing protein n=1 Tax=Cellvibrio sp. TaxID=1965322 RepID=UPI00271DABD6|nr:cohesin domain-containing protein [Cellvibrio sp.]
MKKLFASLFALGLSLSLNANAISIDLIASQSAVNVGDNIEVQVRISGLNDASAPSLGVYDVNFNYDASLFNFSSVVWGDSTLGNQLDLNSFGSLQDSSSGLGWINIFELSLDDALDLDLLQAGEFTLFSVLLNAVAIGSGSFSLTSTVFGDADSNQLSIDTFNGTTVNVSGVSVPEPSSLLLLVGMLAIVVLRAKMSQSQK